MRGSVPGVVGLLLLAAGTTAVATAAGIYLTRYSAFDGLMGEAEPGAYARLTAMSVAEKVAILAGVVLDAVGAALLITRVWHEKARAPRP